VLARASLLVAPTEFIARAIIPLGFDVEIIPNIIELDDYSYRQRDVVRPRLFWMRSFHPAWNPAMAVRVLARLVQEVPDASLIMAGQDKGMLRDIQSLAERLGVISKIRFPGFLDMDGKNREGGISDLYLNTNHIDNMPVAVVEACAMGLPVVATAVGGIPDMLTHGDTGLLVPDNDVEAMVRATRCLLNNPGLAGRLSRNGRMVAQRSAWAQVRPRWETVFENVISRSGSSGHRGRFADRLASDKASLHLTSHSPGA